MTHTALLGLLILIFVGNNHWHQPLADQMHEAVQVLASSFIGMLAMLPGAPWTVTLIACLHAGRIPIRGNRRLAQVESLLVEWGSATSVYLLRFARIGISLANGILAGVSVSLGAVIPMVFKGTGVFNDAPEVFSPAGWVILCGIAVMLCGAALVSIAGLGRERVRTQQRQKSAGFRVGLLMAILAAVLASGFSLPFVYSQGPIVAAMKARGAGDIPANVAVWAAGLFAGALLNVIYPAYLMTKHRSWHVLWENPREIALAVTFGLSFFTGTALMGKGMLLWGFGVPWSVGAFSKSCKCWEASP